MPVYDLKCSQCGFIQLDVLQPIYMEPQRHISGDSPDVGLMERVWLPGKANSVIGDECDVSVRHGLCNADGSPRRYTSKSEMAAEAKKRGLVNHVTHMGTQGGDKSRHTSRWI